VTRAGGHLGYLENVGSATVPTWIYQGLVDGITQSPTAYPIGTLGDIDVDGDLDYVRIDARYPAQCWENIGTPPAYEFVENPLMLIDVDEPHDGAKGMGLLDIDADGDLDLLFAGWQGENFLYRNITIVGGVQVQGPLRPTLTAPCLRAVAFPRPRGSGPGHPSSHAELNVLSYRMTVRRLATRA